jgi:hypothetical protein
MQQSVLIAAMRGPDGVAKDHPSKKFLKFYRRCVVISAFDKRALTNPYDAGGGSYTGPSVTPEDITNAQEKAGVYCTDFDLNFWEPAMDAVLRFYIGSQDSLPLHFYLHVLHGVEIIGYKHSDGRIRAWFNRAYVAMAHDLHLAVESEERLDARLNDNEKAWRADASRCTPEKR